MSDKHNSENESSLNEPKKVSLADAIKNKLNQKKQSQNQANVKGTSKVPSNSPVMKSQQTKKQNNQRRRTGV